MSKESHRKYLEASARREALKMLQRKPGIQKDGLRTLKIQTIEPWKRVIAGIISLGLVAFGVYLIRDDSGKIGAWLIFAGIMGLLFSIFGWRKTLDGLSNAIDIGDILDGIF